MSMSIHFDEHYKEISYYTGTVDDSLHFTVEVHYDNSDKEYSVHDIKWDSNIDNKSTHIQKSEERIRKLVRAWYESDLIGKDY